MNEDLKSDEQSRNYEIFMHRAYQEYDTNKPGRHNSYMKNLIDSERGKSWVKHLGSTEKQLSQVKKYMSKAMDRYLKMGKIPKENKDILKTLKVKIENAHSSSELMDVVDETLNLTEMVI